MPMGWLLANETNIGTLIVLVHFCLTVIWNMELNVVKVLWATHNHIKMMHSAHTHTHSHMTMWNCVWRMCDEARSRNERSKWTMFIQLYANKKRYCATCELFVRFIRICNTKIIQSILDRRTKMKYCIFSLKWIPSSRNNKKFQSKCLGSQTKICSMKTE